MQSDVFLPGTSFEHLARLYQLDELLRQAFICALSQVEIFLRTLVTYQLTERYGPFVHHEPSVFRKTFDHIKWLESIEGEIIRAQETFIEHFKSKYAGFPKLPLWMAVEVMSFGSLSKLYSGLLPDPQRSISAVFEVHHSVLHNWLHALTYIRNVCAHHSRLWNRELAIRPDIPRKIPAWRKISFDNTRVFGITAVLEWITNKALLPVSGIEKIYKVMNEIIHENDRFKIFMGIPREVTPGLLWNRRPK
jgi:abortive infection bacteriophage resistance protein